MNGLNVDRRVAGLALSARAAILLALIAGATGALADDSSALPLPGVAAGLNGFNGAQIYDHLCQACHMPEGSGAIGAGHYPKLAGDPALVSWQYVALTILNGKNGMPSFGHRSALSDAQVADVVNYVRGHFGNRYKGVVTAKQVAGLPHPSVVVPLGPG